MRNLVTLLFLSGALGTTAFASAPPPPVCGAVTQHFENNTVLNLVDSGVAVSTISVSGMPDRLWDVDLTTFLTHSFSSDIDMTLTSPGGTVVTITSDNGSGNDNIFNGTQWDDSSDPDGLPPYAAGTGNPGLVTDHPYVNLTTASPLTPEEPLATFRDENPNGIWTLRISDDANNDSGALNSWALDLTSFASSFVLKQTTITSSSFGNISIPDNSSFTEMSVEFPSSPASVCGLRAEISISHTFSGDLQAAVISPSGKVVTLTSNNGGGANSVFNGTTFKHNLDLSNQVPFPSNTFAASNLATDTTYTDAVVKAELNTEESFHPFFGEPRDGVWTLRVADTGESDTGTITQFSLAVTTCEELADTDSDGIGNSCDNCPSDPTKSDPGVCGCGTADSDTDGDGSLDCQDSCVVDPAKSNPGICGCGVIDADLNSNSILDCFKGQELKSLLAALKLAVTRLKPPGETKKSKKISKQRLGAAKAALAEVLSFAASNGTGIATTNGADLNALISTLNSKVLVAFKIKSLKLKKNKKAANAANDLLFNNVS